MRVSDGAGGGVKVFVGLDGVVGAEVDGGDVGWLEDSLIWSSPGPSTLYSLPLMTTRDVPSPFWLISILLLVEEETWVVDEELV